MNVETGRYEDTYTFKSSADDKSISISDSKIPNIDETTWEGKDEDSVYLTVGTGKAGLMNSVDKYILDQIANVLGITTEYVKITDSVTGDITSKIRYKMDLSELASNISEASNKFSGGGANGELQTLTAHGNLPKGTTIEDLEKMTYSEVLKAILFETAAPTKQNGISSSISFTSPYNTTLDVGRNFPTSSNMSYSFTPEKWNWKSAQDSKIIGTPKELNKFKSVKYYYNDTNNATVSKNTIELTGTTIGSDKTIVEGTNGYFFGVITYEAKDNAVNSLGEEITQGDGAAKGGTTTTGTIYLTGAWRVYSNCATSTTTKATAAKWGNVTPSVSTSIVNKNTDMSKAAGITNHGFNASGFYAAWAPKTSEGYSKDAKYVMYVPDSKSITAIKAYNGITSAYDVNIDIPTPTTITLNNGYALGTFKVYTFNNNGSLLNYYFTIG